MFYLLEKEKKMLFGYLLVKLLNMLASVEISKLLTLRFFFEDDCSLMSVERTGVVSSWFVSVIYSKVFKCVLIWHCFNQFRRLSRSDFNVKTLALTSCITVQTPKGRIE